MIWLTLYSVSDVWEGADGEFVEESACDYGAEVQLEVVISYSFLHLRYLLMSIATITGKESAWRSVEGRDSLRNKKGFHCK